MKSYSSFLFPLTALHWIRSVQNGSGPPPPSRLLSGYRERISRGREAVHPSPFSAVASKVELYLHSPVYLHGTVLNYLSTF
jgi:hypothetical protein